MYHGADITLSVLGPNRVRITLASGLYIDIYGKPPCNGQVDPPTLRLADGTAEVSEDSAAVGTDAPDDLMRDLLEAWAADAARRGLSAGYIKQQRARIDHLITYRSSLKNGDSAKPGPIDRSFRPGLIDDALRDHIRLWLAHLAEHGMPHPHRPAKPCGPKTLNNHLSAVRKFFRWGIKNGLVATNPTEGTEWSRVRKNKGRVFSGAQAWALFQAAQQDEMAKAPRCRNKHGRVIVRSPFYRVLIATGARAGSAQALRVRDFLLNSEPPRVVLRADTIKGRAEQEIIISAADRDYFAAVLAGLPPGELALTRPHHRVLRSDAKAAGVPVLDDRGRGVGFHCIRRWHGTEMDRQGFSIEQIRQRLGHKDIQTTAGYLVRELEEQQGVAETLAKMSPKSLDAGNRIADAMTAKTGSPTAEPKSTGRRLPVPVFAKSNRAGVPVDFGQQPPGRLLSGGSDDREPVNQAPGSRGEWAQQDSNLLPSRPGVQQSRMDLLHKIVDLLERESPGRKAEGRDESGDLH